MLRLDGSFYLLSVVCHTGGIDAIVDSHKVIAEDILERLCCLGRSISLGGGTA